MTYLSLVQCIPNTDVLSTPLTLCWNSSWQSFTHCLKAQNQQLIFTSLELPTFPPPATLLSFDYYFLSLSMSEFPGFTCPTFKHLPRPLWTTSSITPKNQARGGSFWFGKLKNVSEAWSDSCLDLFAIFGNCPVLPVDWTRYILLVMPFCSYHDISCL